MKPIVVERENLGRYSVAPYNFVSLPSFTVNRYENMDQLPSHNNFKDKEGKSLLSGYIDYKLIAKTPIIVSRGKDKDGNNKFFKNLKGRYAIPGSSIRGVVRTNAQILSYSNVVGEKDEKDSYPNSEIEDSKFLYRDIASNDALTKQYKDVLGIKGRDNIARNLKVGYMKKEENKFYIYPAIETKTDNPYYKINEIRLRKIAPYVKGIDYMYKKNLVSKEQKIRKLNKSKKRAEKDRLVNSYRRSSKPYFLKVSYNTDSKNRVTKIGNPGECSHPGYLLTSNHISGKISHYLIPGKDKGKSKICVSNKFIAAYIDDMLLTKKAKNEKGKIKVEKDYLYYALPKEKEVKPVFYIQLGNDLHFGFTPYLRVMYSKSILDGIPKHYNDVKGISYVEGIFGFSNKVISDGKKQTKCSYRSRVSFEDAEVMGEAEVDKDSTIEILLAEPKLTSFNLYLEQDLSSGKDQLNLYEGDFTLRGFKQYWLKDYVEDPDVIKSNMTSKIYPLKEGTSFRGRIHFYNLNEDELGLLLWALKLGKGTYHNMGLGKPYGFGRVKVEDVNVYVEDLEKKYRSFSFDFLNKKEADNYISHYKNTFSKKYLNGRDIDKEKPIRELMKIKTKVVEKKQANYYRYMKIEPRPNEFRDRKVLPGILDYDSAVKEKGQSRTGGTGGKGRGGQQKRRHKERRKSRAQDSFGVRIDLSAWEKNQK